MNLFEAAKFYGDFSQVWEDCRAELSENFDDNNIAEEKFLSCPAKLTEA